MDIKKYKCNLGCTYACEAERYGCSSECQKVKITERVVTTTHFVNQLANNVDDEKLSDADFRQFIRNTLPIVDY